MNTLRSIGDGAKGYARTVWDSAIRKASVSAPILSGSLDSPSLDAKDDDLNRRRIAREIYRIICDQAAHQSVRIGLFGDWGYGKTTIARWVPGAVRFAYPREAWRTPRR